jgi:hypothetical protein
VPGPLGANEPVSTYWTFCWFRFRFRYVLHPFAAKYSHWMGITVFDCPGTCLTPVVQLNISPCGGRAAHLPCSSSTRKHHTVTYTMLAQCYVCLACRLSGSC